MERFLYKDLYKQEDKHWWHLAKRAAVVELIERLLRTERIRSARNKRAYFLDPSNSLRASKLENDKRGRPKILDLGCGTGKNLEVLSRFGETFGVDMSGEAIKFCKQRGFNNVKVGTSYKTGFKDGTFDLVTLLDVLEHTDDDKTLAEINRILDRNGVLIINVPAFQWLWSRWDEVLHHRRRYTKKSLEKALTKNGFKVVKSSYMFSFLVLPAYLVRQIKSRLSAKEYASDFGLSSPIENRLLIGISALERKFLMNFGLPFGTSLICVAKKVK